jgi:hypothetical protein
MRASWASAGRGRKGAAAAMLAAVMTERLHKRWFPSIAIGASTNRRTRLAVVQ